MGGIVGYSKILAKLLINNEMRKEMNVKKVKCIYFGVIYSMIVLCLSLKKCMCLWRYRRSGYTVSYGVAYVFFRFYL